MAETSIKARYAWRLRAFVALNALVVFVAFTGTDLVRAVELSQWYVLIQPKLLLSLALPLATLILDGIVTADFKAVLVYWRHKDTLPGHCAFSVHGKADPRVDMKELEDNHGPLPDEPSEQNELWYKLSKRTADKASVDHAHFSWLLSRDLTNLSFALALISAGLGLTLRVALLRWIILVAAQALLYIVLSRVASIRGVRFVTTVLAEASVAAD